MRRSVIWAAAVLAATSPLVAWDLPDELCVYDVHKISQPPKVDGQLDDACWKLAPPMTDFTRMYTDPVPVAKQTVAGILFDDENLYLGIRLIDPDVDRIKATTRVRDASIWRDDCVEIRFTPGHRKKIFTFLVNAIGTRSSGVTDEWEAAATRREGGYFIEIRIPLKPISAILPDPGEVWGFNIIRHRRAGSGETTQWSQSNWTWGDPVFYGDLIFAAK